MMNAVSETIAAPADAQSTGQVAAAPPPKSKRLLRQSYIQRIR